MENFSLVVKELNYNQIDWQKILATLKKQNFLDYEVWYFK